MEGSSCFLDSTLQREELVLPDPSEQLALQQNCESCENEKEKKLGTIPAITHTQFNFIFRRNLKKATILN